MYRPHAVLEHVGPRLMTHESMIIHDFHGLRSLGCPAKANAKLVINSNAELAFAVAFPGFESIARRRTQKFQRRSGIELRELSNGNGGNSAESPRDPALE